MIGAYKPANYDLYVGRGNNVPFFFRFVANDGSVMLITEMTFDVAIVWSTGAIRKSSAAGSVSIDPSNNICGFQITLAESRLLPCDEPVTWELEMRNQGIQRIVMTGNVIAFGGQTVD